MEHFLNPDVTTYAGMVAIACVLLAIGFFVRSVQLVRNDQAGGVCALMGVGAVIVGGHVFITANVMHDYTTAQQDTGTPFVLWLLAEAAFISLGMAAYHFKKDVGMATICATPFLTISALLVAYFASGTGASWAMMLFDIVKYVALVPLVLSTVPRAIFPRRWQALHRQ